MTLKALLQDVPHEVIQMGNEGILREITAIAIDSRKVTKGGLYICLLGLSVDGHRFVDDVARAGAGAVLVEKFSKSELWPPGSGRVHPRPDNWDGRLQLRRNYPPDVTVIEVENTRQAMAHIAANAYGRPAEKLQLIGVTGTNGKTTTTHFIDEILRGLGHTTGLIGTNGIRIGGELIDIPFATSTTPDPLELQQIFALMLEQGVKYVVMEVSSHALAFYKMEGLVFDVGVFTNLTQDHLDLHGTMDNYRLAKAILFAQSKFGVGNVDDESTATMFSHLNSRPRITYGLDNTADIRAIHIQYGPDGTVFELHGQSYTLPAKGRFNVYNALAAIGTMCALGLDSVDIPSDGREAANREAIHMAVGNLMGVPGRIQSVPNNIDAHVLVDYAHSPDGVENIITSVREFTTGRVIIIIGCGGDRDKTKRPIMGRIAGSLADYCILTSDNPRTEDPMTIIAQVEEGTKSANANYEICENRRDAIFIGAGMLKPGDALIIAGKGHEDYQIIDTTKHHFSDYETAVEALAQK